jgi:hypothetical protein
VSVQRFLNCTGVFSLRELCNSENTISTDIVSVSQDPTYGPSALPGVFRSLGELIMWLRLDLADGVSKLLLRLIVLGVPVRGVFGLIPSILCRLSRKSYADINGFLTC